MISIRFLSISLILSASIHTGVAHAEYGGQGYGGAGYGQQGMGGGYGSYPFAGGNYGMSGGMGGGMSMGGGGGGGAKYESRSDANEIKETGAEYTKQISESTTKALEASAQASQKAIEQITNNQPEEVAVSEAVTKAAEEVGSSLSSEKANDTVSKYEKDITELGKTIANAINLQTQATKAAIQASGKEPQAAPTMGGLITSMAQGGAFASRSGGRTSPIAAAMNNAGGNTVSLGQAASADRTPASSGDGHSHGLTSQAMGNAATSIDRGMVHNPPSGY